MRTAHDIDAVILMATTLASKRRPAELAEIVAAADLIQGSIPFAEKLGDAIQRLSALGLIEQIDDRFTLTPNGDEIMAQQPKKRVAEDLLSALRGSLAGYHTKAPCAPLILAVERLDAAIKTHKATRKAPGKNLLMPKPRVDRHFKVEGRWRRVPATR